jgi:hypothetical protein
MSETLLGTEHKAWEKRVADLEKQLDKGKPTAPKGEGQKGRGKKPDSEHKNEPCKHGATCWKLLKHEQCPYKHTRQEVREARKAGKAAGKGGKGDVRKEVNPAGGTDLPWKERLCYKCGKKLAEHPDGRFCERDKAAVAHDGGDDKKKDTPEEGEARKRRKGTGKGKDK